MREQVSIFKVYIDGPFSCGKTAFLSYLSEFGAVTTESVENDEPFTLKVADFGRLTVDENILLYLFARPNLSVDYSHHSFDNFDAYVMMVDSAKPDSFDEFKALFDMMLWARGDCPIVVIANKQNKPNALHPDDLRIILRIPDDISVLPCVTSTGEGVAGAMIALCEQYRTRLEID